MIYSDRLYVVVRRDLAPIYKMVQGSHAICKFQNSYSQAFREWNNHTLVFVEVPNLLKLHEVYDRFCLYCGITMEVFYEPDLFHHMTALAFMLNEDIPYDIYSEILDLPLASL